MRSENRNIVNTDGELTFLSLNTFNIMVTVGQILRTTVLMCHKGSGTERRPTKRRPVIKPTGQRETDI